MKMKNIFQYIMKLVMTERRVGIKSINTEYILQNENVWIIDLNNYTEISVFKSW